MLLTPLGEKRREKEHRLNSDCIRKQVAKRELCMVFSFEDHNI